MTYSSSYVRFEQTSIMFLFEQFALHGFLSFDRIRTNDLSLSLVLVCIRITTNLFWQRFLSSLTPNICRATWMFSHLSRNAHYVSQTIIVLSRFSVQFSFSPSSYYFKLRHARHSSYTQLSPRKTTRMLWYTYGKSAVSFFFFFFVCIDVLLFLSRWSINWLIGYTIP